LPDRVDGVSGEAIVVPAGEGEQHARADRTITILADLPELSVSVIEFEPSFSVGPHLHDDHVDSFYVLEGEVEFMLADRTVRAGPGTLVAVPPNTVHGFGTPGPGRARMLNLHAPDAGFVEMVRGTPRRT
jgi:quercetin dioxygenase-like cupin family protein